MQALSPWIQQKFWGADNKPLAFGKLYFFISGSQVVAPTYAGNGGSLNPQPLVLDILGQTEFWLDSSIVYDIILKTGADVDVQTWEKVSVSSGGGSTPSGQFILKFTPIGTSQAVETDLATVLTDEVGIISHASLDMRGGVSTIKNKVTGAFNDLGTALPNKGEVVLNGSNSGEVDSYLEVVNQTDISKKPFVLLSENLRSKTPLHEIDVSIVKQFDGEANTFKMWDTVHGESNPFAHLSDIPAPVVPSTKQTASLQFSKPGSINANSVISPPTDGSSWFGGNNMGCGTNSAKQFKVTNVASTLLRYVTNSAGSIQMRLSYIPQTPLNTLPYNAGGGTLIASWTSTIPNTSGADWYFFNFNNILNVTIPQGAIVFLEVTNKTATSIDGIACIVNLEEI